MTLSASKVAIQLTHIDYNLFVSVQPIELIGDNRLGEKAVNYANMKDHFNEIGFFVASEILKLDSPSKRADMISQFISISKACIKIFNFNSAYAILAGLGMTSVSRLKESWKRVPKKKILSKQKIDALYSMEDNYKNYKEKVMEACSQPHAIIPYLGLYSKYLFALEQGTKTMIDGMINFEKMRMIYSQLKVHSLPFFFPFVFTFFPSKTGNSCSSGATNEPQLCY